MIGQIGPFVKAGKTSRIGPLMHVIGGLSGGAAIGIALGLAGALLALITQPLSRHILVLGVPALLVVAGLIDLRIIAIRPLSSTRQTPRSWSCTLGETSAAVAWGADLGMAISTRICHQTLLAIIVFALSNGNPWISVITMAAYGGARAATVATVVALAGPKHASAAQRINSYRETLPMMVGGAALSLGGFWLLNTLAYGARV